MPRDLAISDEAKAGLLEIEDYILEDFGLTALLDYQKAYEGIVAQIRTLPFAGNRVQTKEGWFYTRLVNSYTTIFYSVNAELIELQFIVDNRRDWQTRLRNKQ